MIHRFYMAALFALALGIVLRGGPIDPKQIDLTQTEGWVLPETGVEVLDYQGQKALRLKNGPLERVAFPLGLEFGDGIIELDIAAIPSYTGLIFRARTDMIYEGIYFRPQNSRLEDPVRRGHTVQYISNPRHTWYYLREIAPEKYEAGADLEPGSWFHVKVKVEGTRAEVFVNNSQEPCLVVDDLKHGQSRGSVGLWVGNGSAGTFANLRVTPAPQESSFKDDVAELTAEQRFMFDMFLKRQSVRKFKPDPVPDVHLQYILDAARRAPTSGNQQPWKFLVVQDRAKLDRLKQRCVEIGLERLKSSDPTAEEVENRSQQLNKYYGDYLSAPVYVAVLVDKGSRYPSYNIHDGPLGAGYLMLAARALGYGTVFATDSIPFDIFREVFNVPEQFDFVCVTPVGVPDNWPEPKEKKPLSELAVFEQLVAGVNYKVVVLRKAITLPTETLQRYAGVYRLTPQAALTVTVEEGRVFVQATGQRKMEIFPESEKEFFLKVADVQITFTQDVKGIVTGLVLRQAGRDMPAEKEK